MDSVTLKEGRVLVVDDDEIIREYLECLLAESGYSVTTAADFNEVKAMAGRQPFRLIVSDLVFIDKPYSGLDIVKYVISLQPECRAIILTNHPSTHTAIASLRMQAVDYLTKPANPKDMLAAVGRAFAGHQDRAPAAGDLPIHIGLSARERELLDHLYQGRGFNDVAEIMGCSLSTVKTYTQRIYKKLDVHSRSAAVHEAIRQGILRQQ